MKTPKYTQAKRSLGTRIFKELSSTAVIVVGVLAVKSSVASTYHVPTSSMIPTIQPGDRIVSDQKAFGLRLPFSNWFKDDVENPQYGDIVIFESPSDGKNLVKRVVALEDDIVEIRNGKFILNGMPAIWEDTQSIGKDSVVLEEQIGNSVRKIQFSKSRPYLRNFAATRIPKGHFFALGDNRDNSADSRVIGAIPMDQLKGRAHHVFFSTHDLKRTGKRL